MQNPRVSVCSCINSPVLRLLTHRTVSPTFRRNSCSGSKSFPIPSPTEDSAHKKFCRNRCCCTKWELNKCMCTNPARQLSTRLQPSSVKKIINTKNYTAAIAPVPVHLTTVTRFVEGGKSSFICRSFPPNCLQTSQLSWRGSSPG